jgi:WD40 repeat protein
MKRNKTLIILGSLVTLTAATSLVSNIIASDLWEWLRYQPWYSVAEAVIALSFLLILIFSIQTRQGYNGEFEKKRSVDYTTPINNKIRNALLKKIEIECVQDRLHQGLRNLIRIELNLTEVISLIQPMLRLYTIAETGLPVERGTDNDIYNIFDAANGRLLILGDPGTGKTTLLMELAEKLIADAKAGPSARIPLVFSLSRWTLDDQARSLSEWLIDELTDIGQYSLSRSTASALVLQNQIIPLLDGLDEVEAKRRKGCVDAIHSYLTEHDFGQLVVCCRTMEYQNLPKLNLRTAIRIEKLRSEEVNRYLSMEGLTNLRHALEKDPALYRVIDTPLWLHVAVLAVQAPLSTNRPSVYSSRESLYAQFVEYVLNRKSPMTSVTGKNNETIKNQIGWLATEMRWRSQTQFSLEQLDYSWIPARYRTPACRLVIGTGCGLVLALAVALVGSLAGGFPVGIEAALLVGVVYGLRVAVGIDLMGWLCGALTFGVVLGILGGLVGWVGGETVDGLRVGLGIGLIIGLILGVDQARMFSLKIGPIDDLDKGRSASRNIERVFGLMGLLSGLAFGFVFGVINGLPPPRIVLIGLDSGIFVGFLTGPLSSYSLSIFFRLMKFFDRNFNTDVMLANRGTYRSLLYAAVIFPLSSILGTNVGALLLPFNPPFPFPETTILSLFVSGAAFVSLHNGGSFALRHYAVRALLWWFKLTPFRYVHFLNQSVALLFLVRRGGSYEFFHATFRDYMSDTYGSRKAEQDRAIEGWSRGHTLDHRTAIVNAFSWPLLSLTGHAVREHSDYTDVNTAVFSPDGLRVVTAGSDHTARIWDATTGEELVKLEGHTDYVETAEFSSDGRYVATASRDDTARVWDTFTGGQLEKLEGHTSWIHTAKFAPDCLHVVTASSDKTARVWDAASGEQLVKLEGHTDQVWTARFSPDGKRIVTASSDLTARVWDAISGRQLAKLQGHSDSVWDAGFSPDGERIVTASAKYDWPSDKTARVWDSVTGRLLAKMRGHKKSIYTAMFSPDGQRILTASGDGTARLWDAASGRELIRLKGHSGPLSMAAFSPDGRRVVTANASEIHDIVPSTVPWLASDNAARVWDAATGEQLVELRGHKEAVNTAMFSPDGQRIVTASRDSTAAIFKIVVAEDVEKLFG